MKSSALIPTEFIEQHIYLLRGERVMLDRDLAILYRVESKVLLQAVKRNLVRFPADFMFQLSAEETSNLRSQFVTSSWGGHRYLPYVFTEQGVAMLSGVLRSKRAVLVNIAVMRTFVKLRRLMASHKNLAVKLRELEKKYQRHDRQIKVVFDAIRQLMVSETKPKKEYGFR